MMYSDKSNAARFAELSIWPVLARIANLPSHISNKNSGYAGNTLLGFLPYIKCPAGEEKNSRWPNHHGAVFHQAWYHIFRPFKFASKDGYSMQCGDNINRTLVIRFPISNNDLEEA
jgi:hypothetical protein